MSSSLSTAGPSHSDAASSSSSSSSYFMCKLSTNISKALGTRWETKDLGQSTASGKAHVSHRTRKIGNVRKQPISGLLERKIGNLWSRLGSCLALGLSPSPSPSLLPLSSPPACTYIMTVNPARLSWGPMSCCNSLLMGSNDMLQFLEMIVKLLR